MNIIFATTELPPLEAGGAGYLVARLRSQLQAQGHRVRVVVAADGRVEDPDVVVIGSFADHLERSKAVAEAVAGLVREESADLIEFQDFYGTGFAALADRDRYGLTNTRLAIRFHGPMSSILDAIGHPHSGHEVVLEMEWRAFDMADAVLVPSAAMADHVASSFGVSRDRLIIAEPARSEAIERVAFSPGPRPQLVVYGKRAEVKGSLSFMDAVIPLLESRSDLEVRFIGSDDWSWAEDRSVTEILLERIPGELSDRVAFEAMAQPGELGARLAGAWLVVVPSLFETFCLAAHEVRAAGLPLLVADLDAYRGFFDEATGAVIYDGSVLGLRRAMDELLADPQRLAALAAAPGPVYADPLEAYRSPLPAPRHPQSQSGLATLATQSVAATSKKAEPTVHTVLRRALRILPRPVAGLAMRVVPQSIKDRFRDAASWPAEEARRARVGRHERVRRLAATMPGVEQPDVSIVIPCYEQGQWLMDAIASVYEQTYDSWEIIVVDDGSTTAETIGAIDAAAELPRVGLVRQENRGLAAARNAGIAMAKGRYIVPLDADDELEPDFLDEMVAALDDNPRAAFAHCWAELYGDVSELWVTRPFNLYQMLLSNSVVGCVVLRQEALASVGGYDETMVNGNEDWELWVRLLLAGWLQVDVRRPLFRYRRLGTSMSTRTEARFEAGRMEIVERHRDAYSPEALVTMKRGWYPAVSLICGPTLTASALEVHDLDDCEAIVVGGEPDEKLQALCRTRGWPLRVAADAEGAVAMSRGKYVTDAAAVRWAHGDSLLQAAMALEDELGAFAIATDEDEVLLWRRWALVAGDSPHHKAIPGGELGVVVAESPLARGAFADPAWELPPIQTNLPIHRQSPEVEGFVPSVL
ncbi:MAG: glycosyltransferase [Acidimicrobiia bacterium]|nr:glycosyltransferase [Acidimicrobiia bacterium]